MQKYSHIITSQAFILQLFVMIVAYEFSSLFFEMYWTQKLSNFVTWLPFTSKAIQWVPIDLCVSKFIAYVPSMSLLWDKPFL